MKKAAAVRIFESLASGIRLDAYRLLVKAAPEGLVAGELAAALDLPPANLSFHLRDMAEARLVAVEQEGRFQRYRANLDLMADLVEYLTEECCSGRPERCAGAPRRGARAAARKKALA